MTKETINATVAEGAEAFRATHKYLATCGNAAQQLWHAVDLAASDDEFDYQQAKEAYTSTLDTALATLRRELQEARAQA